MKPPATWGHCSCALCRACQKGISRYQKGPQTTAHLRNRLQRPTTWLSFVWVAWADKDAVLELFDNVSNHPGMPGSQWITTSLLVAHAVERGQWLAWQLFQWSHAFINDWDAVPKNIYSWWNVSVLKDEDLAQSIHQCLQRIGKYVRAMDIVHSLDSPEMMAWLKLKKPISLWLCSAGCASWTTGGQRTQQVSLLMDMNVRMSCTAKCSSSLHGPYLSPKCVPGLRKKLRSHPYCCRSARLLCGTMMLCQWPLKCLLDAHRQHCSCMQRDRAHHWWLWTLFLLIMGGCSPQMTMKLAVSF